ncbi:hypothetical protein [Saccharopolyspora sp. NPDC002376]
MKAEDLTVGQWWIVALATSALIPAAIYFCFRSKKGAAYSVILPALVEVPALIGIYGRPRGHMEIEAMKIEVLGLHSISMLSIALLLVAMRPEARKAVEKARLGEEYEIPKWKTYFYGVLLLIFIIVGVFMLPL